MATISEDRQQQLNPGMALKVPCKAVSTVALVLNGEQTVGGVVCVTGDRVLVKHQANTVDNGIYIVSTGAWTRAQDFDGRYDATKGSLVVVTGGASPAIYWVTSAASPVVFGTSPITFDPVLNLSTDPIFGTVTATVKLVTPLVSTPLVDAGAAALDLRGAGGVGGVIRLFSASNVWTFVPTAGGNNISVRIDTVGAGISPVLEFANAGTVNGQLICVAGQAFYDFVSHNFRRFADGSIQFEIINTASATSHPTITGAAAAGTVGGTLGTSDGRSLALSCGRLQFPATQAASSDANTLDDYEEGTWTPAVGGTATYTAQTGEYTKIGRSVFVRAQLTINVLGTGSTNIMSGLPFTNAGMVGVGEFGSVSGSATNIVSLTGQVGAGATSVALMSRTAAQASETNANAIFANATSVSYSHTYHV